jgi:hypothetical protein
MNDSNDSLNLLFFQATFKAEVQELVQVRARKNRGMALQIQINISGQASQQRVSHCFSLIGSWGYSETQDIHIYIHSAASCKQIPPPRYVLADVARNHRNHRAMALNQSAYRRCPTQCLVTQLTPGGLIPMIPTGEMTQRFSDLPTFAVAFFRNCQKWGSASQHLEVQVVIYVCFFEASISGCLLGKNCHTYRANELFLAEKY